MRHLVTSGFLVGLLACLLIAEAPISAQSKLHVDAAHHGQRIGSRTGVVAHPGAPGAVSGGANPREQFEGRDDRTGGSWPGVYGRQAFLVPIPAGSAHFNAAGVHLERGSGIQKEESVHNPILDLAPEETGLEPFDRKVAPNAPLASTRVPLGGGGLTTRNNVTFAALQTAFPDPKTGTLKVTGF